MLKKYSFAGEIFFQKVAKKNFFYKTKIFSEKNFRGAHTRVAFLFHVFFGLTVFDRKGS